MLCNNVSTLIELRYRLQPDDLDLLAETVDEMMTWSIQQVRSWLIRTER